MLHFLFLWFIFRKIKCLQPCDRENLFHVIRPVVVTPGVSTARTATRDGTDAAAEWRNAAACASVMESGDGASRERIAENRQFADDRLSIKASNCGDAEHDEAVSIEAGG